MVFQIQTKIVYTIDIWNIKPSIDFKSLSDVIFLLFKYSIEKSIQFFLFEIVSSKGILSFFS